MKDVLLALLLICKAIFLSILHKDKEKRIFKKFEINHNLFEDQQLAFNTKQYSRAINYTQQMLDDLARNNTDGNLKFELETILLDNLSACHVALGNFKEGELLINKVLSRLEPNQKKENKRIANLKYNLGFSYLSQVIYLSKKGSLSKDEEQIKTSQELFNQVINIRKELQKKKPSSENESWLSKNYQCLGLTYQYQKKYNKAKQAYWYAIEWNLHTAKFFFGEKYSLKKQDLLRNSVLFSGSTSQFSSILDHIQLWSDNLICLGQLYYNIGNYTDAERLYKQALDSIESINESQEDRIEVSVKWKRVPEFLKQVDPPDFLGIYIKLAELLVAKNQPKESFWYIQKIDRILGYLIYVNFNSSSEIDRLAFIQTQKHYFSIILSIIWGHLSQDQEALQFALDFVLKRKAITASALAVQNEALYSDRYPHLTDKFKELQTLSDKIVKLTYSFSPNQRENLDQLQAKFDTLQRQLAEEIPEMQLEQDLQTANRHAVARNLPENSVLIEFVRFDVYDFKAIPANGEERLKLPHYIAFILSAGKPDRVEMVDLGEAARIDEIVAEFLNLISNSRSEYMGMFNIEAVERLLIKKYDPEALLRVSEALLIPILSRVGKAKHLLFAPDSDLNLIPFATLPIDSTGEKLLIDNYLVSYLSVGRDVLRFNLQAKRSVSEPLIVADPDFDLASSETDKEQTSEFSSEQQSLIETLGGEYFRSLPDTKIIGQQIAEILPKSLLYQGEDALETRIINTKCPGILFFITHGVFISKSSQQKTDEIPISPSSNTNVNPLLAKQIENPMLRSLLALAGANTWLSGGKVPEDSKGVLFAQDILSLDLWGTEMVGLVACETGVGETSTGEGVFGMRRAFAVAGAETLIMSLWKVPARVTTLLMTRFLHYLKDEGNGKAEALQKAQKDVRDIKVRQLKQTVLGIEILKELSGEQKITEESFKDKEDEQPLKHFYYWGAWICQGKTTSVTQLQTTCED